MALSNFVLPGIGWQICAHPHTPINEPLQLHNKDAWEWKDGSLPFDAVSWLHSLGIIDDPLVARNDLLCRWVEDVDWVLRCQFCTPAGSFSDEDDLVITLSDIDCYADIFLNGAFLGSTKNQFRPHVLDVESFRCDGLNELIIHLRSARLVNAVLESAHGVLPAGFDSGRVHARRNQSLTGWDWASRLSSTAVLTPPALSTLAGFSISSIHAYVSQLIGADPMQHSAESARVTVATEINSRRKGTGLISIKLVDCNTGAIIAEHEESVMLKPRALTVRSHIEVSNPRVWWPLGFGDQPLYRCEVTFTATDRAGNEFTCTADDEFGIRTVALERQKDAEGESFTPVVNGQAVFCRGTNWVPTTMLPSRATDEDVAFLVTAAAKAGMNCLRVWGGGIYETDFFYKCCDRLGILVWQDFMFACAAYPIYREFVDEVQLEATHQVTRLRNHPCILLWCGNNENEWLHQVGQLKKGNEQHVIGERLWADILRTVCEENDSARPYHQSSPFGRNRSDLNDELSGDRHQWEVWSGWESPHIYLQDKARFISEFGLQAMPTLESIERFAPGALSVEDPDLLHHQKMIMGQERLARYVAEMYHLPKTLEQWVTTTQAMQGEVLRRAVEHWRRNRPQTSGTLIWQHHDAYPTISWSLIDFYRTPKASWHLARRFFNPILLSAGFFSGSQEYGVVPLDMWSFCGATSPLLVGTNVVTSVEKSSPADTIISVRMKLLNDTGLPLSGEVRTRIYRGSEEPLLLEAVPVTVAPNADSVELVREFALSQLQPLPSLKLSAEFFPDDATRATLEELERLIRSACSLVEKGEGELPPFSLWEGLCCNLRFVEPKFVIE